MERLRTSEENTHTRGFISEPYKVMMQDHIDTIDCYDPKQHIDILSRYSNEQIKSEVNLDNLMKLRHRRI